MLTVAEEAHKTDTGRQRHANEDSYFARAPLFAVADGMGGAQAGEVASRIAAGAFEQRSQVSDEEPAEGQLEEIAQTANREIHQLAQEDSSRAGMGTTLTAAMVRNDEVSFGHVGDSRAYVLRDGQLKRLTKDHSLVEELRRQGRLTEEQAEEHPQRSIITRALGPEPKVEVDTMTYQARPGDVFLLCSDGLTTMLNEQEIAAILAQSPSLEPVVARLIDESNARGGRDNITVVAFRAAEEVGLTAEGVAAARRPGAAVPSGDVQPGRRWPRVAGRVLVTLLIVAGLGAAAWYGSRQIHFLGIDEGGRVALYRGLPYDLPFG